MENFEKEPGTEGEPINLSVATRAANINPEPARVEMYDEYISKYKNQEKKHLLTAILFLAPAVALLIKGLGLWAILPFLITLWQFALYLATKKATPTAAYTHGQLICAEIVNLKPLQIIAMAAVENGEDDPVCWGLKRYTINELPGHTLQIGERIPCAAMFGMPKYFAGIWGEFEPHPICWAIGNRDTLLKCENAIEKSEWDVLKHLLPEVSNRENIDKEYVYFNEDLSERIDIYEKPEEPEDDTIETGSAQ